MSRVSYEILSMNVDKLYQKKFPPNSDDAVAEHCEYIATFIESCGWTTDQYMQEYTQRSLEEYFPDVSKLN